MIKGILKRLCEDEQRQGRMGGEKAAGPDGTCVCPKCDHEEEHKTGSPCMDRLCPKCGAEMTRK